MSRIEKRFAQLKADKRAGLVAYVSAGDPDATLGYQILKGLPAAGADLIELGMPFTDPMADGPSIQLAGQRALKAGMTLGATFDMVRRFRNETGDNDTPILLMGYYNLVYQRGVATFCKQAAAVARHAEAAVVGTAIVDRVKAGLDAQGRPKADLVAGVFAYIKTLAEGVRSVRKV